MEATEKITHGSLFSGIGGFDLAAEWMGWKNLFHCEWNEFGQRTLKYYWPHAKSYKDITKTDFNIYRGRISILTGGFPCQPYSAAGKRLGKEDDRHLWPEMLRAIREIKPQYVVAENVAGLISWNEGLVFNEVQTDLENEGYEVQPFVLPAAAVNAPHRRDRVWFVAHRSGKRCNNGGDNRKKRQICNDKRPAEKDKPERHRRLCGSSKVGKIRNVADSRSEQLQRGIKNRSFKEQRKVKNEGRQFSRPVRNKWEEFPTQSPICSGNDGFPDQLDGITFSKWRQESIKAYGNAIVPQVAYQIFKAIKQTELTPKN